MSVWSTFGSLLDGVSAVLYVGNLGVYMFTVFKISKYIWRVIGVGEKLEGREMEFYGNGYTVKFPPSLCISHKRSDFEI